MCRYGFSEYKNTYACFKCRKRFKRRIEKDIPPEYIRIDNQYVICPNCENKMENLGKDPRLPKKAKIEEWKAMEYLKKNDFNFFTCGCTGIGIVPHTLQEAYLLIEQTKGKTNGEIVVSKIHPK